MRDAFGRDIPEVLFRWMTLEQAIEALAGDVMKPTWRHLLPDLLEAVPVICLTDDPRYWRNPTHNVCLAVRTEDFASSIRGYDGNTLWSITSEWDHLISTGQQEKAFAEAVRLYEMTSERAWDFRINEWVSPDPIEPLSSCLIGVSATRDAGPHLPWDGPIYEVGAFREWDCHRDQSDGFFEDMINGGCETQFRR
jgi:hypothetical protein